MRIEYFSDYSVKDDFLKIISKSIDYDCAVIGVLSNNYEYQADKICAEFGYQTIKLGNDEQYLILIFNSNNDSEFTGLMEKLSLLFTNKKPFFILKKSSSDLELPLGEYYCNQLNNFFSYNKVIISKIKEIIKYEPKTFFGKWAKYVMMEKISYKIKNL